LVTDARFREAGLPSAFASDVRLRPDIWAAVARSAWFCGWSNGGESFTAARQRAEEAARMLTSRADAQGSVVVVGHGMMNILIARRLRASGWSGPRIPSPRHWSFGVYRR
jgi:broad specificity phosphatase PhoE